MLTFKMPVAFPTGTSHVIFNAYPGYLDGAFWGNCASGSTTNAAFSSFERSTRRLSPSWNPRNEALESWSLCAATTQYAPPANCRWCNDFLPIMCCVYCKREENMFVITLKTTLPCSVGQNPSLHIHMLIYFFKQCITTRCDLLHKDFSYTIRYCEALK